MGDSGECFNYLVLGFGNFEEYHVVSWGPDLVTFRHHLVTKGEVWAALKFFTCNSLSYFEVGLNYIDLKITEFWACLLFSLKPAKFRLI